VGRVARRSILTGAAGAPILALAPPGGLLAAVGGDRQEVSTYLESAARRITDRAAAEIASRDSWEKVRAQRLEELRFMLGLLPWPDRTPLNVQVNGTLDRDQYTIEKIAFESMPRFYVTGNLYLPKGTNGVAPGIIYVCGHAPSPCGAKTQYQRHGISFAKNGYVAFILDPIQIAETFALHHGASSQQMFDWYSRGYTPAGVETWNAIRAIDYLETRPEVDRTRIGMTGRSGGAAMSWFTGAIDPRVRVVAPVMGISTYAADVRENTQRLHCDCMFPINALMQDMIHQGALIAPRPLLMAHGSKDDLFPVSGYTEFQQKIAALYASYGRPDDFQNIVVDSGHADSDFLRERVIRWFDRYFLNISDRSLVMAYTNALDTDLLAFPKGPPDDAVNFRVHETFTTRAPSPPYTTPAAWQSRREDLIRQLREKVFAAVPASVQHLRIEHVQGALPPAGHYEEVRLSSRDTVVVRALVRRPAKPGKQAPALLYVASDGETLTIINDFLRGVNERDASVRLIVFPRGVSEAPWDREVWRDMQRNAMFVGHTVDSMRLCDVLVGVEALRRDEGVDPSRIMVLGAAGSGVLGLYAAILDPQIAQAMLINPPVTHADAPIFLNALRYTDLPEAAALMAPRHLTFYGRMPAEYEYTRHVYALYGKSANLARAMNVQAVVEGRYDHNFASGS